MQSEGKTCAKTQRWGRAGGKVNRVCGWVTRKPGWRSKFGSHGSGPGTLAIDLRLCPPDNHITERLIAGDGHV